MRGVCSRRGGKEDKRYILSNFLTYGLISPVKMWYRKKILILTRPIPLKTFYFSHLIKIPTIRANLTMTYVYDQISGQSFGLLQ